MFFIFSRSTNLNYIRDGITRINISILNFLFMNELPMRIVFQTNSCNALCNYYLHTHIIFNLL